MNIAPVLIAGALFPNSMAANLLLEPPIPSGNFFLQGSQIDAFHSARVAARKGTTFFLTGRAGTGKSAVIHALRECGDLAVSVLAPTGLAALNVGGATIHSQFGIRPGANIGHYRRNPDTADWLNSIDLLVIDEVSMVRADILDTVDFAMRTYLCSDAPFGGKGVMLVGDFHQLEPVVRPEDREWLKQADYMSHFAFHSRAWLRSNPAAIELTEIHRQNEADFIAALNVIRTGGSDFGVINSRVDEPDDKAVKLAYTNAAADEVNETQLAKLMTTERVSTAQRFGEFAESEAPSPAILRLRIGCRVMITRNGNGVVNGDCGHVVEFSGEMIKVELDDGPIITVKKKKSKKVRFETSPDGEVIEKELGSFTQYPLKLAYAVTAHKSQGQTFDRCHLMVDGRPHAHGIAYVALSRARTLAGLSIGRRLGAGDNRTSPMVGAWQNRMFPGESLLAGL